VISQEAQRDISHYLMHRYNWVRPHQFNDGLPPPLPKKSLTHCPGWVDHYIDPLPTDVMALDLLQRGKTQLLDPLLLYKVDEQIPDHLRTVEILRWALPCSRIAGLTVTC